MVIFNFIFYLLILACSSTNLHHPSPIFGPITCCRTRWHSTIQTSHYSIYNTCFSNLSSQRNPSDHHSKTTHRIAFSIDQTTTACYYLQASIIASCSYSKTIFVIHQATICFTSSIHNLSSKRQWKRWLWLWVPKIPTREQYCIINTSYHHQGFHQARFCEITKLRQRIFLCFSLRSFIRTIQHAAVPDSSTNRRRFHLESKNPTLRPSTTKTSSEHPTTATTKPSVLSKSEAPTNSIPIAKHVIPTNSNKAVSTGRLPTTTSWTSIPELSPAVRPTAESQNPIRPTFKSCNNRATTAATSLLHPAVSTGRIGIQSDRRLSERTQHSVLDFTSLRTIYASDSINVRAKQWPLSAW